MVWVELGKTILLILVIAPAAAVIGFITHETLHWLVGYIYNAGPQFTDYHWFLPAAVDFDTPETLPDRQIQGIGGVILVFPASLVLFSLYNLPTGISESLWRTGFLFFLIGGSGVSEKDIIAIRYPNAWRELANGEKVDLTDLGYDPES